MATTTNVHTFNSNLEKAGQVLNIQVPMLIQLIANDLMNRFVEMNPVDTGYSQSQWRIGINGIDESEGHAIGTRADLSKLANLKPGDDVFLTNSVHYLQYLEEGSSTTAPAGFIRISIAAAQIELDSLINALETANRLDAT